MAEKKHQPFEYYDAKSGSMGKEEHDLYDEGIIELAPKEEVHHPSHYGGDVTHEVIKCLEAWGLEFDALRWNACKYIARAGKKGDMLKDLRKAKFYLDRRIAALEREKDEELHP